MTEITLIQCTDSKRDTRSLAKNLYDESRLFRKMRRYARAHGQWAIVSARHGLVWPETALDPYNDYGLVDEQAKEIARELEGKGYQTVRLVAGDDYTEPLVPELEVRGIEVLTPVQGLKIGEREKRLVELARVKENHTLC